MKSDFLLAITQLAAERNLPKELVFKAVETALSSTYRKDEEMGKYEIDVRIFPASGEIKVFAQKAVVDDLTDEFHEIVLKDARKIQKDVALGDTLNVVIFPPNAGRIGVQTAKQVVMQRLREAEHEFIFGAFAHREGDIIAGVVQQVDPRQIIVDLGKAEGILPRAEQVHTEHYREGQRLNVYLLEVSQTAKGPRLLLSRTHPSLVRRIFELEVPEISQGIIEIRGLAREAGFRTKLAVAANQEGLDPVGSCIGLRGVRIQNIINELQNEKIDVIQWHEDPEVFVANSLSPAKVLQVIMNLEDASAIVVVPDGQLSLAIGKEGQNARLAAKLTGWKIDIKSASSAEEELATLKMKKVAAFVEVEEPVVEAPEEPIDEAIPIEELEIEEPAKKVTSGIRFAEDILVDAGRSSNVAEKSKKQADDAKPKGKKRSKRVRPIIEDDDLDDPMDEQIVEEDTFEEGPVE